MNEEVIDKPKPLGAAKINKVNNKLVLNVA